ncbi:MAG: hypothetical protein Q4B26_15015, partial [Eubacteriales bacterium]|nr:hypothetical protein [Eubacteriales bacterium]
KKKYRDVYTSKYHFDEDGITFRDLISIHPTENRFHVMYSEYLLHQETEGTFDEIRKNMGELIVPKERDKFEKFWEECLEMINMDPETTKAKEGHFSVTNGQKTVSVKIIVSAYTDVKGNPVLMCYTR